MPRKGSSEHRMRPCECDGPKVPSTALPVGRNPSGTSDAKRQRCGPSAHAEMSDAVSLEMPHVGLLPARHLKGWHRGRRPDSNTVKRQAEHLRVARVGIRAMYQTKRTPTPTPPENEWTRTTVRVQVYKGPNTPG